MIDTDANALTGWLNRSRAYTHPVSHVALLPLDASQLAATGDTVPPVEDAIRQQTIVAVADGRAPTADANLNYGLEIGPRYHVFPMVLRTNPVGVLIVDWSSRPVPAAAEVETLAMLTKHAGVVLGSLLLCVGRAQRQAIEEERSRIAADIHDTVSQSLFGLAYSLNACTEMLPQEPEQILTVKQQLAEMQPLVFDALSQIRSVIRDILPGDLSRDRFISTLQKQLSSLSLGNSIQLSIVVPSQFNRPAIEFRQQLMLITYEAIANIARHAAANRATIELHAYDRNLHLAIVDNGVGFDPDRAIFVTGLGVDSIRQRVEMLGGVLDITSQPSQGTHLVARIPLPE